MTSTKPLSLNATMAIAAVLALGSHTAAAQSVSPDVSPAPAAAAPASAPAIVLPSETSAPTVVSNPVVEVPKAPAAVAETTAPAPAVARRAVHVAAARDAAPSKPTPVAPVAKTHVASPPIESPVIESPGRSAPLVPVPPSGPSTTQVSPSVASPPATTRTSSNTPETAWEIGLAALAGVGLAGGLGIANARRRRRASLAMEEAVYDEAAASAPPPEPIAETSAAQSRVERPLHQPFPSRFAPEPAMSFAPAGAAATVPTGDEREALIARMVAAEPDAENPFTSLKSRRRRARMILSRREAEQHGLDQQGTAKQPFDWRTYRQPPADAPAPRNRQPALTPVG